MALFFMKKYKVLCPNIEKHPYGKILFVVGEDKKTFWLFCNQDSSKKNRCKRWIKVYINSSGGIEVTKLPDKYHLDLNQIPVVELCRE